MPTDINGVMKLSEHDIREMTITVLKQIAKILGITGLSTYTKANKKTLEDVVIGRLKVSPAKSVKASSLPPQPPSLPPQPDDELPQPDDEPPQLIGVTCDPDVGCDDPSYACNADTLTCTSNVDGLDSIVLSNGRKIVGSVFTIEKLRDKLKPKPKIDDDIQKLLQDIKDDDQDILQLDELQKELIKCLF